MQKLTARQAASPIILVKARVLRSGAPYTSTERLVALVVAGYLPRFDRPPAGKGLKEGEYAPGNKRIAADAGLSDRAVRRALAPLCDGPHPIFYRRPWGRAAKGSTMRRRYVYGVICGDVRRFVAGRDQARHERRTRKIAAEWLSVGEGGQGS